MKYPHPKGRGLLSHFVKKENKKDYFFRFIINATILILIIPTIHNGNPSIPAVGSDEIVVDDLKRFTEDIDALFDDWGDKENIGLGKVQSLGASPNLSISLSKPIKIPMKRRANLEESDKNGIEEIESSLNIFNLPEIENFQAGSFGIMIEDNSIVGLGLYNRNIYNIPESLSKLKNLKYLSLWKNNIADLPASIGQLNKLKDLYISENNLSDLPESFGKLTNLERLHLEKNSFPYLPENLCNLTKLQEFYIAENDFKILHPSLEEWMYLLKRRGAKIWR